MVAEVLAPLFSHCTVGCWRVQSSGQASQGWIVNVRQLYLQALVAQSFSAFAMSYKGYLTCWETQGQQTPHVRAGSQGHWSLEEASWTLRHILGEAGETHALCLIVAGLPTLTMQPTQGCRDEEALCQGGLRAPSPTVW